jgi:hypothetical protein
LKIDWTLKIFGDTIIQSLTYSQVVVVGSVGRGEERHLTENKVSNIRAILAEISGDQRPMRYSKE